MKIELSHSVIFLRDDGIVQMNSTDHTYTLSDLKEIARSHGEVNGGAKRPLLVVVDPLSDIDNGGREYMASEESTQFSVAEAFVINSLAQKILANFYLKVNKPGVPTRFFSNIAAAEEWLRDYLPSDL